MSDIKLEPFGGDKKKGQSIFGPWERKLVDKYVSKIPENIETYHLTLMTLPWCLIIVIGSYLARYNINWMWIVSLMIVFQYITDLFDGAVGRYRNTGLIRWGYYMDHYLDYVFLCSILIGYSFIVHDPYKIMFFVLIAFGAFMVNSYLSFAATNEFKIVYLGIGPTEIRLLFIIINTLIIIFGKTYMTAVLPYALLIALIGLNIVIYKTSKYIWKMDMENKNKDKR